MEEEEEEEPLEEGGGRRRRRRRTAGERSACVRVPVCVACASVATRGADHCGGGEKYIKS